MRPDDIPVLSLLRQSISFNSQRQTLIAQNVANSNTPGYTPKDFDESAFQRTLENDMRTRSSSRNDRLNGSAQGDSFSSQIPTNRTWSTIESPDSETTINGNSVVVEEQMVKASETRMRYETALALYQKSLGFLRMSIRPPAR